MRDDSIYVEPTLLRQRDLLECLLLQRKTYAGHSSMTKDRDAHLLRALTKPS